MPLDRKDNATLVLTVKGRRHSIRRTARIDGDHLNDFLAEMELLLHAAGFTYVRRLTFKK